MAHPGNDASKRWKQRNPDKVHAYVKKYRAQNPNVHRATAKKYSENNPEKIKAHNVVTYAVKTGELTRQPCEICGETKTDAHHDDYGKPLEVRWLCRKHHKQFHNNKNSENAQS
jgi:ribosomal protein S27AE